jgi:tRNA (guanine37-N1)-methyltransferase
MVTLKEFLKGKLTEKQISQLKASYDVMGTIAVINSMPTGLKSKEKVIAKAIMELNKNVKTVAKKVGPTAGKERIRPVKVIVGEKKTETFYVENGNRFKFDINKVYFSPRLGSEHLRVAQRVMKNETVFDLFAGVGPYAIPAAKRGANVIAVDINKHATRYLELNAGMNKVSDKIRTFTGDCRKVIMKKEFKKKADRVIMNLPMHAGEFLDVAFYVAKKGANVHFYCFLHENDLFEGGITIIKAAAKKAKRKIKILNTKRCGQLSSRIWRVAIDFKVL